MRSRKPTITKTTKRTKEELVLSIIQEGEFDYYRSSTLFKYYRAFGQRWLITYSNNLTIKSVEQVDENGNRIGF